MRDLRDEVEELFESALPENEELVEVVYIALTKRPESVEGQYNFTIGAAKKNQNDIRKQMLLKAMEVF